MVFRRPGPSRKIGDFLAYPDVPPGCYEWIMEMDSKNEGPEQLGQEAPSAMSLEEAYAAAWKEWAAGDGPLWDSFEN